MDAYVSEDERFVRWFSEGFLLWVGVSGVLTFLYMLVTRTPGVGGVVPERLIEALLLGVPAVGLLYAGYWLHSRSMDSREVWRVGWYAVGGTVAAAIAGGVLISTFPIAEVSLRSLFFYFVSTGTEGALLGVLVGSLAVSDVFRDESDEQRSRNEDVARAVSMVAHDLRNPLNVAQLRTDLASEECNSEHLEAVVRSHERMEELIGDMLLLARGTRASLDVEPVDLRSAVEGCWANVDTGEARLVVESTGGLRADEGRLERLLENLLRNAVEHGGDDVTVTVGRLSDGFYVADDGPGIPEDLRDEVFGVGTTTNEGGTGLGLAIVERVASAHGWDVSVTDSAAGGARFEFRGVEPAADSSDSFRARA